jgi:hypothetical protein
VVRNSSLAIESDSTQGGFSQRKFSAPKLDLKYPSLIINIPVGLWSIFYLINNGILPNFFLNYHILIGFGLNALLPVLGIIVFKNYQKEAIH